MARRQGFFSGESCGRGGGAVENVFSKIISLLTNACVGRTLFVRIGIFLLSAPRSFPRRGARSVGVIYKCLHSAARDPFGINYFNICPRARIIHFSSTVNSTSLLSRCVTMEFFALWWLIKKKPKKKRRSRLKVKSIVCEIKPKILNKHFSVHHN